MKKLTGIAGLLILCCIGGCAPVQKEATFLKSSIRFHFPGEDMEESFRIGVLQSSESVLKSPRGCLFST